MGADFQAVAVPLNGTGVLPVTLQPPSFNFGNQPVGVPDTPKTFTLKNNTSGDVTITGVSIGGANPGDYSYTTTCGASLAAKASCTIDVVFTPTTTGPRPASLDVTTSAPNSPHTSTLAGKGI